MLLSDVRGYGYGDDASSATAGASGSVGAGAAQVAGQITGIDSEVLGFSIPKAVATGIMVGVGTHIVLRVLDRVFGGTLFR